MTKSSKVKLFVVKSVLYISISGCSRVIKNVFVSHVWIVTVVGHYNRCTMLLAASLQSFTILLPVRGKPGFCGVMFLS